ncbi:Peptidoglycan/xylan/chitin deacetylase, PgdA/CDA1 family [Succiniclasticum ruminis]|uniref:Peptidoglycan/xylan/chitin deacetylase, PgdA/CDA1 family n=2 Tax=Succiniclasticum ruminis TaxID=40841 RepID=A0A1G6HW07_9FIRM|nr:Peptidoglycan/xylan/chitin deacetylase, PgdA/CDA1 family [Succiniclasticum ruminis]
MVCGAFPLLKVIFMRVLCIMGVCYLAALVLLWAGRRGKISRKVAAVVSAVCLLAGSGALAAAVYPIGNSYGKTVNRLTDLSGNGAVVVPSPGSARTTAPLPDGAAQKSVPESGMAISAAAASGELPGPKDNRENVSVISSGTVHDKWIALTFDDGPYPPYTDRLLDVLKAKRIHATFFLVAEQAQQYPELVQRMTAEGHTVGLHAFRHRDFLKLTEEEKRKDLEQGKNLLRDITGKNPVYWRPPHGFRDFSVMETAAAQNLTVVNWSVIPRDWTGIDSQEIFRRVMDKADDGAIVLLHDGDSPGYKASRQATVDAVAPLIDSLREKGYHLVSLEEYVQAEKRPGQ